MSAASFPARASSSRNVPVRIAASSGSPAGRVLVLGTLVLLVTIRLFTDVLGVLPGPLKLVDVPLLAVLVGAAVLRPAEPATRSRQTALFSLSLVFLAACTLAFVANPTRVAAGPVILFLYGFCSPLAYYYAARRLWPPGNARALSRLLVALGVLQLVVVVVIDLPKFLATRNPDFISGTFGENAYQLVFFLIVVVALVAAVATFEPRRPAARLAPVFAAAALLVVFLAQYRALLISAAAALVLAALLLQRARGAARLRAFVVAIAVPAAFVSTLGFVALHFPSTKFDPYVAALRSDPGFFLTTRLKALSPVRELLDDEQRAILVGTGPGTFSSRAWLTFANYPTKRAEVDSVARAVKAFTGGRGYRTDVSDRYVMQRYTSAQVVIGSRSLTTPFSSYTSLLAEVGVFGLLAILAIYLGALVRSVRMTAVSMREATTGDSLPGLLLASSVALFVLLQMAFLDNWLEVARITVPAWILLAVATKEFEARHGKGAS